MKRILIKTSAFLLILFIGLACCKEDDVCVENIKADCACYKIYAPVCGCNGKTYGNDCEAECAGIADYTEGACD